MSIVVRRLGPRDDGSAAASLLVRFFQEEGFATAEAAIRRTAARMMQIETCGLFIAELNAGAVGVATVSLDFGIEYGWSAEMGDLYVVPRWRGQGVARALVGAVETFLWERQVSGYQVTVAPLARRHHDITAFYARLGFGDERRFILFKTLSV